MKNKPEKLLAQCSGCRCVEVQYSGRKKEVRWQNSLVLFGNLPSKTCLTCAGKTARRVV